MKYSAAAAAAYSYIEILRNPGLYLPFSLYLSLSLPLFISAFHMYTTHASISTMPTTKFLSVSTTLANTRALTLTTKRINAAAHLTRIEIFGEYSSLVIFCPLYFGGDFHGPIRAVVHSDDLPPR